MKKSVQYIGYIIPILFAIICLTWFCKINKGSDCGLQKADYANHGKIEIKQEVQANPSTCLPLPQHPFLGK